jgi:hypothetical protein
MEIKKLDVQKIKDELGADEVMIRLSEYEATIEMKIYNDRISCRLSVKLLDLYGSEVSGEEYVVGKLKKLIE